MYLAFHQVFVLVIELLRHVFDSKSATCTVCCNSVYFISYFPCSFFKIPMSILPEIRSSAEIYGRVVSAQLLNTIINSHIRLSFFYNLFAD